MKYKVLTRFNGKGKWHVLIGGSPLTETEAYNTWVKCGNRRLFGTIEKLRVPHGEPLPANVCKRCVSH